MLLLAFQNSTLCVYVSKPKWEGNLFLVLRVMNFSLDKMQVNIQGVEPGVEHDLRQIEQIFGNLLKVVYNNKDTSV